MFLLSIPILDESENLCMPIYMYINSAGGVVTAAIHTPGQAVLHGLEDLDVTGERKLLRMRIIGVAAFFFHTASLVSSMAGVFYNLDSDEGLKNLDEYLLTRSYITGYQASKDDLTVYSAIPEPPSSSYVNASRWYHHIDALLRISGVSGDGCGVTVEGSAPERVATPPVADSKAAAAEDDDDDDDVDLFGEETEEEKKAAEERAASIKASTKKKESGKSSVLMDIKPWDDETDMKKLEEAVRSVEVEGLFWGASKLVPVGYGIKKLQIMMTIIDDLVSVDDLIEERLMEEPINEYVQSCDIVAFNKI